MKIILQAIILSFVLVNVCFASEINEEKASRVESITSKIAKSLKQNFDMELSEFTLLDDKGNPLSLKEFEAAYPRYRSIKVLKDRKVIQLQSKEADKKKEAAAKAKRQKVIGMQFPKQDLVALDGIISAASFKDKPTFVSFYFAECPPCIKEVPLLNQLREELSDKYRFIAITFDDRDKAAAFKKQYQFDWPTVFNARPLMKELQVNSYPAYYVLNKQAVVTKAKFGFDPELSVEKLTAWLAD